MAQNLDNFDAALKIDYLPVIREQLENSTYLFSKLERNERDVSGKRYQMTAHYARSSGVGSGAETDLPTAGNQGYLNPYDNVKYHRGRIQVSGRHNGPAQLEIIGERNLKKHMSEFGEPPYGTIPSEPSLLTMYQYCVGV